MDCRTVLLYAGIILLYSTQMMNTAQGSESNDATQLFQHRQDRLASCGGLEYDVSVNSCCGGQPFAGAGLYCCDHTAYNPSHDTCCNGTLTRYISQLVSACCGSKAYNPLNHLCCDSHLHPFQPGLMCCGAVVIDTTKQLCCGASWNISNKTSEHDRCCGSKLYNSATHCCSRMDLKIHAGQKCNDANKMNDDDGGAPAALIFNPERPNTKALHICGTEPYDPYIYICCERNLLEKMDGETQCCGKEQYIASELGTLCCDGKLYRNVMHGSQCHKAGVYDSNKETVCESVWHPEPHGQCCGQELFNPRTELCCNGHRRSKTCGLTCCGAHVYNASDPGEKCCSGQIHKVKGGSRAVQCCGTQLVEDLSTQQCCSSSQWQLVYTKQDGFSCCGHRYYNTSIYSCCEEDLLQGKHHNLSSPTGGFGRCLLLSDLGNIAGSFGLCHSPIYIGTLESTWRDGSQRSVVLTSILHIKWPCSCIKPKSGTLTVVVDHCSCPQLKQGRQYLWCNTGKSMTLFVPSQIQKDSILSAIMPAFKSFWYKNRTF